MIRRPPRSTPLSLHDALPISATRGAATAARPPSSEHRQVHVVRVVARWITVAAVVGPPTADRKSTRLNSSHANISYAVFCLKKKIIHFILLVAGTLPSQ